MIRPEKDLVNPPGQWINTELSSNVPLKIIHEKTLDKAIEEYLETVKPKE